MGSVGPTTVVSALRTDSLRYNPSGAKIRFSWRGHDGWMEECPLSAKDHYICILRHGIFPGVSWQSDRGLQRCLTMKDPTVDRSIPRHDKWDWKMLPTHLVP